MTNNNIYLNRVELKGFVGANAEPKEREGGKTVLNFSIATSRFRGEGENREQFTEWHRIAAWGKLATSTGNIAKGAHVHVIGELRSRAYTNEGGTIQTYEIVASKIEILLKEEGSS